jgi:alkanesulfonate monooxygenase SsuD/methylene tetrahydromethanopterin reductase-like flavin-dependent oxidoreductase (luciferase family)
MRAWQEKDTFAFNGRFNQQRYVNIWPRPIQQPHPPVWIPGGGSVETWRWCAEMDYVYCYLSYYGYKAGQATMQGFWDEMDRLGKDRNPYRAGFLQFVGVAESRSEAMERYAEAAEYFYGRCLHVDPRFASPPGYNTEATMRAGLESQVKRAADEAARAQAESAQPGHNKPKDQLAGVTTGTTAGTRFNMVARNMEEIVDRGYVVVGSPKDVAEQLEYVAKTLNVGHFMLLLQYGNMSKELTKYNTKLFAEQVMPKLKPLFSEWEDKWWPKPMDKSARAALPAFRPAAAE